MSREEIHKLVGGYATGTLTPEEREALFTAALEDQELFDALAKEQALRDLLSDPAAKAEVLAALAEPPRRWHEKLVWLRPLAAAVAMAGLATMAVIVWRQRVAPPAPAAVSAPAPQVAEVKPVKPEVPLPQEPAAPQASLQRAKALQPTARTAATAPRQMPAMTAAKKVPAVELDSMAVTAPPPPRPAAPAAVAPPAAAPAPVAVSVGSAAVAPPAATAGQLVVVDGTPARDAPVRAANSMFPVAENSSMALPGGGGGGRGGRGGGGPGGPGVPRSPAPAPGAMQLYNLASSQTAAAVGGVRPAVMALARSATSGVLALRYSFLRKAASSESVVASPSELQAGETLEIQVTPAADGLLTFLTPEGATIASLNVTRLQPTTVPVPPGVQHISVTYSIQSAAQPANKAAPAPASQPLTQTVAGITYVGARTGQGAIRFTIDWK